MDNYEEIKEIIDKMNLQWEKNNKLLTKIKKEVQGLELDRINYNINKMESAVTEIGGNVEVIQGKIKNIEDMKVNSESEDKKPKKKQKEVTYNCYEEEVVNNISIFGHKIIDELTKAAKVYTDTKSIEANMKKLEEEAEKAYEDGVAKGKEEAIKDLASKFADLDELFQRDDMSSEIVVTILKNNGLERDEEIYMGNKIEINEQNRVQMEGKCSFDKLGVYEVVKSTYLIKGNLYVKGELRKTEE